MLALEQVRGAYSLLLITDDVPDRGARPERLPAAGPGRPGRLPLLRLRELRLRPARSARPVRELEPGEVVVARRRQASRASTCRRRAEPTRCIFEHVYFARPDSRVFGDAVSQVAPAHGRAARARGAGRRRHRGAGARQRPLRRHRLQPRVGPAARVRADPQPLRGAHLHRAQAVDPALRGEDQAQPGARADRGQAGGAGRRLDRARHHLAQDRAHDARRPAPPRSTCASRRRPPHGPATTASTPRPATS